MADVSSVSPSSGQTVDQTHLQRTHQHRKNRVFFSKLVFQDSVLVALTNVCMGLCIVTKQVFRSQSVQCWYISRLHHHDWTSVLVCCPQSVECWCI